MALFGKWTDKHSHSLAGTIITILTGFIAYRYFNCTAIVSWVGALLAATIAGLIKELIDKYIRKKEFSKADWLATFWGGVVGGIILIPYFVIN